MSLLLELTSSLTEKDAVFTSQFIFNPLVVEFFIVMVATSSDVMAVCVGSAFFSTAGRIKAHFSTVKAVCIF